jgi:hypothetical protein
MDFSFMGSHRITPLACGTIADVGEERLREPSKAYAGMRFTMLKQMERQGIILAVIFQVCILDGREFARTPG